MHHFKFYDEYFRILLLYMQTLHFDSKRTMEISQQ